ncbi:unnamed protein product [Camellia sinensis]
MRIVLELSFPFFLLLSKFMYEMKLDLLPQDCIGYILSFASARDICRMSLVSPAMQVASESDILWEKFLPLDYEEVLSRLVSPIVFKSKKELFLKLCNPVLIDKGEKMLWLDKLTGKKSCMLSARELSITWADHPLYWSWKPLLQSRFAEVVELISIWWLEINAKINTRMLSPNTSYKAYLIVKFANRAYGLDSLHSKVSVEVSNYRTNRTIYLRHPDRKIQLSERLYTLSSVYTGNEDTVPCKREDGWLEIELGEFYNDGSEDEVKMSLKEVSGAHLKGGLIVGGIEIRPKKE